MSVKFTLKQLRYFVAAGETESIIRASENIHVSQPSISTAISQLEEILNLQLFIRHHAQGITLTTAGESFFREARSFLNHAEQLQAHAGDLGEQIFGLIQVGCFIPLAPMVVPELCHPFTGHNSGVNLTVKEANQADLLDSLKQGFIDLAITYDLALQGDIDFIPLASLSPYVLIAASHPLAKESEIDLDQLVDENLILLDLPLSHDYFMSLFMHQNLKPKIYARTQQTDVLRVMVAKGYGYSIANVRPVNQHSLDGSELKYLPLKRAHLPLTLGIATLKNRQKTRSISAFIDYCRQRIEKSSIPGIS